jgi:DNA topoisomerase-1
VDFLTSFYFGSEQGGNESVARSGGLKKMVTDNLSEIDARSVNSIPLFRDEDGRDVVVRVGRYGPYLQRGLPGTEPTGQSRDAGENGAGEASSGDDGSAAGDRAPIPEGVAPDELTPEKVHELFLGGGGERKLGEHPETGEPIVLKSGRYGPYVSSGERKASLLRSQSPESLSMSEALRLLTLPRVVGAGPDGAEVLAANGRYGPYVKRGDEFRSLESEEQLFTVTLDEALALLAAPKARQRRAAAPPLREMGADPSTEKPLVIKDGRFGPYVTDGETNASLRRGQTPEALTLEEASEMLAEKRAKGPAPRKKAAAKKAPAKKAAKATGTEATAKKAAAKKTTAKKAAPKKAPAKKAAPKKAVAGRTSTDATE